MARVLSRETVHELRWLKLVSLRYADALGKERTWEAVARRTRPDSEVGVPATIADAVAVLAVLRGAAQPPQLLLVRQFRPPVACDTIELPAGLIDAGESPQEAAVRELREETGYVASAATARVSAPLPLSPGLTDESIQVVEVDVDLDADENQSPKQDLEETESIEVLQVPLAALHVELARLTSDGARVFGALHTLAIGMRLSSETTAARPVAPAKAGPGLALLGGVGMAALALGVILGRARARL